MAGGGSMAFDACVVTRFATRGSTRGGAHVTGVRFLAPGTPAKAPKRDTLAYLVCLQVQQYLEDGKFVFELPLQMSATHHRLAVWEAMQRIPAGRTRTYGDLA